MLFRRTIFITGFPGFIASHLVERLADAETQFFLLAEPKFVDRAMSEAEEIADFTNTPLENYVIIEGDITQPGLDIAQADLETIKFETTDVFHLAAAYDLAIARDHAYAVNLEGTKNVNDLVRSLKDLRRYNYVSTCYIAGCREGDILESDLEHEAGFHNFYEETKYLAEIEVEKMKPDHPVTIFRPSVVVGDSMSGETVKYDGIYYLINYLRKAPTLFRLVNPGNTIARLNLVPVDFIVDAMAALAGDKRAVGKTIALADPDPLTTAELFDVIAKDMTGRRSEFSPPPWFTKWFLNTPASPPITGLPHYGVPYFFISQRYDTAVAGKLLAKHGIKCPAFPSYVSNLLDFVEENPKL